MRHFTSQSPIMAELQPRRGAEPELLNGGDDLNDEREDADATESVKKRRRKKKRSKAAAPGKRHHFFFFFAVRGKTGEKKEGERRVQRCLGPPLWCRGRERVKCAGRETFQPVRGRFCPAVLGAKLSNT